MRWSFGAKRCEHTGSWSSLLRTWTHRKPGRSTLLRLYGLSSLYSAAKSWKPLSSYNLYQLYRWRRCLCLETRVSVLQQSVKVRQPTLPPCHSRPTTNFSGGRYLNKASKRNSFLIRPESMAYSCSDPPPTCWTINPLRTTNGGRM